ncbi:glutamate racemase [Paenibacillus sp. LMG 31456]|uniref:Glutamate racemase n=1 Tax=Paenibacillus foliorum TaxID=2654974 RepID=A0A972K3N3_9BACL|nr:glutamate racemase [Paenibacillus foliorum]NOU98001.1 glutamate racemase [Paenibacillus foliorum]
MQQAIAILDSGVGGLTVAKEVMRQLPQEKIIYFGDTARTPYGPRSPLEVIQFTHQIVDYLLQFQPKMIVIACNTATAVALDEIRARLSIPVVGVIHPGARAAIKTTRNGMIGVIGTEGTIKSSAYELALRQISPHIQVVSQSCPQLVPLVEKGLFRTNETQLVVEQTLRNLTDVPMDCLILGCTHYPFLTEAISTVMGPNVTLISSADETAREISTILYHKGMLATSNSIPVHQFFCSGDPYMFKKIAQSWLNEETRVTPVVWQVPHII